MRVVDKTVVSFISTSYYFLMSTKYIGADLNYVLENILFTVFFFFFFYYKNCKLVCFRLSMQ